MLVLTAMLSAVPVALPATFTLAAALGAKHLALKGVLLTRLSALHEAATIDVLCADKTGTLTENKVGVAAVRPLRESWTADDVLAFAALASSSDGRDPIDVAIRRAARSRSSATSACRRFANSRHSIPPASGPKPTRKTPKVMSSSSSKGAPAAIATDRAAGCGRFGRIGRSVPRRLPDLGGRERLARRTAPHRPRRASTTRRGPIRRRCSASCERSECPPSWSPATPRRPP